MPGAPTTTAPKITFAPGARVLIRDAEWVVRRVDPSAAGGQQLLCVGVSELVREREAIRRDAGRRPAVRCRRCCLG